MDGDDAGQPAQPESAAAAALAAFRAELAALTPRVVVTPVLVALNVLVFAAMVARGVSPLAPTGEDLLAWGANFGPLSAGGQPWRLLTAMFLHIGVIHLLMNMWVLWDAGRLVERLLGPAAFASAYLLAGLAGSCASVLWHPDRLSAGASGAVFGIFGVLGAFLLRRRRSVPPAALASLSRSSLFFVGYNVVYGLAQTKIDMAAHLGGLAGGFAAGLVLVHELTPTARAGAWRRAGLVLAVGLVGGGGGWSRASRFLDWRVQSSLAQRELPGASIKLPAGKDEAPRLDYGEGSVTISVAGSSKVFLGWQTNEMATSEELRKVLIEPLVQSTGQQLSHENEIVVGGRKGRRYALRAPGSTVDSIVISLWPCGARAFNLLVRTSADATRLEQRMRDSFQCKPDPARDGQRSPIRVQIDAGPEFGSVESPDSLLVSSLDGEVIAVTPFPGRSNDNDVWNTYVPKLLSRLFDTAFQVGAAKFGPMTLEVGPNDKRMVWRGGGRKGDRSVRLLAVTIDCEPDRYIGVYFGNDTLPEARGLAPLLAAHCSATPTLAPPLAEVARAACARGDRRACALE